MSLLPYTFLYHNSHQPLKQRCLLKVGLIKLSGYNSSFLGFMLHSSWWKIWPENWVWSETALDLKSISRDPDRAYLPGVIPSIATHSCFAQNPSTLNPSLFLTDDFFFNSLRKVNKLKRSYADPHHWTYLHWHLMQFLLLYIFSLKRIFNSFVFSKIPMWGFLNLLFPTWI